MDRLFLRGELVRGLLDERRPLPERLHVQRVAVIAELAAHIVARHFYIHPHLAPARAFVQAKYAILARPDGHSHFAALCLHLWLCRHRQRHGPRGWLFYRNGG